MGDKKIEKKKEKMRLIVISFLIFCFFLVVMNAEENREGLVIVNTESESPEENTPKRKIRKNEAKKETKAEEENKPILIELTKDNFEDTVNTNNVLIEL